MMIVVEAFAQTHGVGRLFCILPKVQVVPPRGVLEQIHNPDGIARLPWIVEPHFRRQGVKVDRRATAYPARPA